jgi:hypothetical protein
MTIIQRAKATPHHNESKRGQARARSYQNYSVYAKITTSLRTTETVLYRLALPMPSNWSLVFTTSSGVVSAAAIPPAIAPAVNCNQAIKQEARVSIYMHTNCKYKIYYSGFLCQSSKLFSISSHLGTQSIIIPDSRPLCQPSLAGFIRRKVNCRVWNVHDELHIYLCIGSCVYV